MEVIVYHGRQSFEIGFEIAHLGNRYSISELIRATDVEAAQRYRNYVATTPQAVVEGLVRLAALVKLYAERALRGDVAFLATLEDRRKTWAQEYALEVLAGQLRPEADAACSVWSIRA